MLFPKDAAQELSRLAEKLSRDNSRLHNDLINNIISKAKEDLKEVENDDIEIFHLIKRAYHYGYLTKEQKKQILEKLEELHNEIKQHKKNVLQLTTDYSYDNTLKKLLEDFLKHEKEYLDYTPGHEKREYVHMLDLIQSPSKKLVVNKGVLEIIGSQLYYDGKIIQGTKIEGYNIEIVGQHYADQETVERIAHSREIVRQKHGYLYLAEPGKLANRSEHEIKKMLGAKHADANITVKVIVPAQICWIRAEMDVPVKFGIETKNLSVSPPKAQKGFRIETRKEVRWAA